MLTTNYHLERLAHFSVDTPGMATAREILSRAVRPVDFDQRTRQMERELAELWAADKLTEAEQTKRAAAIDVRRPGGPLHWVMSQVGKLREERARAALGADKVAIGAALDDAMARTLNEIREADRELKAAGVDLRRAPLSAAQDAMNAGPDMVGTLARRRALKEHLADVHAYRVEAAQADVAPRVPKTSTVTRMANAAREAFGAKAAELMPGGAA